MNDASTDYGTVLAPDMAALVINSSGEISFMFPDYPADAEVPRMVQLLAAVLLRSRDDQWVDEMLVDMADEQRT